MNETVLHSHAGDVDSDYNLVYNRCFALAVVKESVTFESAVVKVIGSHTRGCIWKCGIGDSDHC